MSFFQAIFALIFSGICFWSPHSFSYQIQEYCPNRPVTALKWQQPIVKWRVPRGTSEDLRRLIQNAFEVWSSEGSSRIKAEFAGETVATTPSVDGFSDFFFNLSLELYGGSASSTGLTLINSQQDNSCDFFISEADILLNPSQIDTQQGDLQEVLIHEIGHLLGLSHTFLIGAVMFPNRPPAGSFLRSVMNLPKYHLSSDDKAWIKYLYPEELKSTASISGKIQKNGRSFIGAHIVAVRRAPATSAFTIFSNDLNQTLLVHGDEVVSSFSGDDGTFTIPNVSPGDYSLLIQGGNNFAIYSLSNINRFLQRDGDKNNFPLEFWSNPDCGTLAPVSLNNISQSWANATRLTVKDGQSICGIEVVAHDGGANCGSTWSEIQVCGSGSCSIGIEPQVNYFFGLFILSLGLILLLVIRRGIF